MKLRSKHIAPIILAIFVLGIAGTIAFNLWRTKSSKIPVQLALGKHAGEYDPADIRGSYAFSDISKLFNIPLDTMGKAGVAVRDYCVEKEIEFSEIKAALQKKLDAK